MLKKIFSKIVSSLPQIVALLFVGAFAAYAWTGPTQAPPLVNTPTPLNVSSVSQTKAGDLTIGIAAIKGSGAMSPNLNADKVDDYHAADLLAASGGIPSGMIAMFDTSCPSGWTRFAALDSRFPLGNNGTPLPYPLGSQGGSTIHAHTGWTAASNGWTLITYASGPSAIQLSNPPHIHSFTTDSASNLDPYFVVLFCKKN